MVGQRESLDFPKGQGPWKETSTEELAARFKAFEADTNKPEQFDGVLDYRVSPPPGTELRLICSVSPNMKARDGLAVPCNQCHNPAKFESGGYAVEANGWIVIMGPICGLKHHGQVFRIAKDIFDQAERERHAEMLLRTMLPHFALWVRTAQELMPIAEAADAARAAARKQSRSVRRALRGQLAANGDGRLRVEVPVPAHARRPKGPTIERRQLVHVRGLPALVDTSQKNSTALQKALASFSRLGSPEMQTGEMERRIAELRANNQLGEVRGAVYQAHKLLYTVAETIHELRMLFESGNWASLEQWLAHEGCPVRGEAAQIADRRLLGDLSKYGRTADWFDVEALIALDLPEGCNEIQQIAA